MGEVVSGRISVTRFLTCGLVYRAFNTMDSKPFQQGRAADAISSVELTVVVPTFNERDNISPLLDRLEVALGSLSWEAIFVDDDSPDGTADLLREIAQRRPEVRVIHRIGRRGLSSACVEGVLSSSAPYFAVIDADMQHDEAILPQMLETLKEHGLDIVVGSRYVDGGGVSEGWDKRRQSLRISA